MTHRTPSIKLLLTLGLVATSCAPLKAIAPLPASTPPQAMVAPPPPAQGLEGAGATKGQGTAQVKSLQAKVAAHLAARLDAAWKMWTDGDPSAFASVEPLPPEARDRATLDAIAQCKDDDPAQVRKLAALRRFLAGDVIAGQVRALSEAVAAAAGQATVKAGDREAPLRDLDLLLASEAHPGRRREIAHAAGPALRRVGARADERTLAVDAAARELGFAGVAQLEGEARGLDGAALARLAADALERSDARWTAALALAAKRDLDLTVADLHRCDLPRLMRSGEVDGFFTAQAMAGRVTALLETLGLARGALRVDSEARPAKSPRALALAVNPPVDVRLSLKPASGLAVLAQALHEAGHALLSVRSGGAPVDPRGPVDGAVAEGWGFLLEHLADEAPFASAAGVPQEKLAAHVRASAFRRVASVRQAAALALGAGGSEALWKQHMARAWGFASEEDDLAHRQVDRGEPWGDVLSGELLAAHLSQALTAQLGEAWWSDPRAAERIGAWMAAPEAASFEGLWKLAGEGMDASSLEPVLGRLSP